MTAAAPLPAPTADAVDPSRWSVSLHRLRDRAQLEAAVAFARRLHEHRIEPEAGDQPHDFRAGGRLLRIRFVAMGGTEIMDCGTDRAADRGLGGIQIPQRRPTCATDREEDARLSLEFVRGISGWLYHVLLAAATRPSSTHRNGPGWTNDDPRTPHLVRIGMTAALLSGRNDVPLRPRAPSPWSRFRMRNGVGSTVDITDEAHAFVAGSIAPCACVDDESRRGDKRFDFSINPLYADVHIIDPVEAMRIVSAHRSKRP